MSKTFQLYRSVWKDKKIALIGSYLNLKLSSSRILDGDFKTTAVAARTISTTSSVGKRLPSVEDTKDPIKILKHDLFDGNVSSILPCPRECDVLVIGGSIIGSSIAYFLKECLNKLNVLVVEPDETYSKASALLSAGGMRQQFSCKENIEMSQFGFEFLRRSKRLLNIADDVPPDVQFNHSGYLILADSKEADNLLKAHELQQEHGAVNILLTEEMLRNKFPWIKSEGVEVASLGKQGEGWLDPAALLSGLKGKAKAYGATYVKGKVVGFEHKNVKLDSGLEHRSVNMCLVELPNGDVQPVKAGLYVNAAGAWAGQVAQLAGVGTDISIDTSLPLPVEPRKRYIFSFHCPTGPGLDCPLVADMTQGGFYFRREGLGGKYICGLSPPPDQEPDHSNLEDVDYMFFDEEIWPKLARRVPAFESLKLQSGWAGYYDYNYIDQNLIIGPHPYFTNFLFANGSTGHGAQHSLAIGRAISELVLYQQYNTVDLSNMGFERFLVEDADDSKSAERNII